MFRILALVCLVTTVACQPGDSRDGLTVDIDSHLRTTYDAGEMASFELFSESADLGPEDEAEPEEVEVLVCVGGVCGWITGSLDGNTLTIELPVSPDLVGLPIKAYVPGVGIFTGTY